MHDLTQRRCKACEGGIPELTSGERDSLLEQINREWKVQDTKLLKRHFRFRNYYQVTAFLNGVIWIAHSEDHHPDVQFGFNDCTISYTTHAVGGLTENDFICAAKVDALLNNFQR